MKCFLHNISLPSCEDYCLKAQKSPRISRITETGRNTTVPRLTTSHSGWMVRWLRPRGMYCTSVGLPQKWNPGSSGLLMYALTYEQHWHMHRQCASVILQDDMAHVSSVGFFPRHKPYSITKAEDLAFNNNTTAQRNTVGQQQRSKTTNQSSPMEY